MKTKQNNSARASAFQITFSIALILVSAILLVSAVITTPILGNYPDTTLALSTDTTVTPDAPPTNTTSINVSTSTDFKGTLAGDPTTGVVRVTDAHPAGTYTVTVTGFDSGGATATKTFALTVTTPVTCTEVSFAAATNFGAGNNPESVAVGDFNGDGKQDLAVANIRSNNVSILLGNGDGSFSAPANFHAGNDPKSVAVGDFNGDGKQDLAVADTGLPPDYNGSVSILLGDGAGNFGAATNFAVGDNPLSVAVGDFNADGKQDLAIPNGESDNVSILLGDGTGTFSAATNFGGGIYNSSVAVGDFNGDGKQDLVVTNGVPYGIGTASILLGDGAGNFGAATNFAVGDSPLSVAVGDFNSDGKQDLAVANSLSDNVSILVGDGAGSFSAPTNFQAGNRPASVAVGDFNGDGRQDLAVANESIRGTVSILLGDGTGSFSTPTNFRAGSFASSVAVGDFNGDGKQDLAAANFNSDNISILLRDCQVPVSQITPSQTTCSQFSSGTAQTLGSVQYDVNNDLIQRLVPHSFLYWVKVTAPAGNNTFEITQTITTGNFNTFFEDKGHGTNVFDSNCVGVERSGSQIGNTTQVRFNALAAGTYYIGINFTAQDLLGQPPPNPTTVHYDFTTTGVPDSTSGLDLVQH